MTMTHAVFSIHVPASLYEGDGFRVVLGGNVIPAEPIHTAGAFDDAESWRLGRIDAWNARGYAT